MGYSIKNNTSVAIMEEVTEGTYLVPASGANYISPLADGVTLEPSKDLLERNNLTSSIGKPRPRTGMKSVSVSLPLEAKASATEGSGPEYGLLMDGALGAKRTATTTVSDTSHTTTVIKLTTLAHAQKYQIGDTVLIKKAGAYHLSPITSIDLTGSIAGDWSITLLRAMPVAAANGDSIAALTTYYTANSGHPAISVTKFTTEAASSYVRETAVGCKVTNLSLSGFSTGQLLNWNFSLEGLSFDRTVSSAGQYAPTIDAALPPIALQACVYVDGTQMDVNNLTFSVDNTLGFVMSTCNANGKISSRVTERTVTGSFDPYKQDNSVANFTKFNDNTQFSVFAYAYNPTGTAGEFNQAIAFYMPNCIITAISESDQDGILQDSISFSATRGTDGSTEELYVTFV